jgi:hypothetical protein
MYIYKESEFDTRAHKDRLDAPYCLVLLQVQWRKTAPCLIQRQLVSSHEQIHNVNPRITRWQPCDHNNINHAIS